MIYFNSFDNNNNNWMLDDKREIELYEFIENSYGSLEELARIFDLGIEMLFYLEEDTFDKRDIQSVVSALRGIINVFR